MDVKPTKRPAPQPVPPKPVDRVLATRSLKTIW